jgi:hypothetical protein
VGGHRLLGNHTYFFWRSAKREERRRPEQDQEHIKRDTALLGLSALILAGLILCGVWLKPLNLPFSKILFIVTILAVGAGLAYIFNRTGRIPS